jgi:putative hydrolase of the HAD superfamily
LIFRALIGRPPPGLSAWSYQHGEAKPCPQLFRVVLDKLARQGIEPPHVLYIGNEMAKDIVPAAKLGCRTALHAGDLRSYRPDTWTPPAVPPDAVITDLRQVTTDLLAS